MPRHELPYSYYRRKDSGYFFYKLKGWSKYKPAGTKLRHEVLELIYKQCTGKEIINNGIENDTNIWIQNKWYEFTIREKKAILFVIQKGKCHYCKCRVYLDGRQMKTNYAAQIAQLEHKNPVVHGGSDSFSNLVLACKKCNRDKGIHDYGSFIEKKRKP